MTDCTWTNGNATDVWDDPDNWDNGTPQVGDNVIFDGATSNDSITVDVVAGVFGTFTVKGNYTGLMTLQVAIEFTAGDIGNVSASDFTVDAAYVIEFTTLDIDTGDSLILTNGACVYCNGAVTCDGTLTPSTGSIVTCYAGLTITGQLGAATTDYDLIIHGGDLATSSGTLIAPNASGNFNFYDGYTWNTPTTFTHSSGEVTFLGSGTTTLGNNSTGFYNIQIANFTTVASSTYNFTCNNLDIGGGVSGIFTTSTGTKTINGTLAIGTGASFGTASTNYTLDLNGNLLTSSGTLIAPNASGTFTFSGSSWKTPTTFTHSSGLVTFDGTSTLANDSIQFNSISVTSSLSTSGTNYALTMAGTTTITGTLTANASTITINGNWNNSAGTFTKGTSSVIVSGNCNITTDNGVSTFYTFTLNIGITLAMQGTNLGCSNIMTINGTVTSSLNTKYLYPGFNSSAGTPFVIGGSANLTNSLLNVNMTMIVDTNVPGMTLGRALILSCSRGSGVQMTATLQGNITVGNNFAMLGRALAIHIVDLNDYDVTAGNVFYQQTESIQVKMGSGTTTCVSFRMVGDTDSFVVFETSTIHIGNSGFFITNSTSASWDASGNSTIIFDAVTTAQNITTNGRALPNVTINNTTTDTTEYVTVVDTLIVNGLFYLQAGTFDTLTNNVDCYFNGGITIDAGITLLIGTGTMYFGTGTYTDNTSNDFYMTNFGNIEMLSGKTLTLATNCLFQDVTLQSSSTIVLVSFDCVFSGDWTDDGGSITSTTGSIIAYYSPTLIGTQTNAVTYQTTPTYDGSDETVHPSILYFENGWGDDSNHDSWKYWLAITPYPGGDPAKENPSILVSNDGVTWQVPPGLTNPISAYPGAGWHNADTELIHNDSTDELYCYYIKSEDGVLVNICYRVSSDGITWGAEQFTNVINEVSPTVLKDGATWFMWSVVGSTGVINYRTSADGITWGATTPCVYYSPPGRRAWHLDVIYRPTKQDYIMMLTSSTTGTGAGARLFTGISKDRINWSTSRDIILNVSVAVDWDDSFIYRTTCLWNDATNILRVWYSAQQLSGTVWHTGYVEWTINSPKTMTLPVGGATYDCNFVIDADADITYNGEISVSGSTTGTIKGGQAGTDTLTITGDLTILGELHANYGSPSFNSNSKAVITIIMEGM